ncbi:MAG TPA: NADP-dependent glyceraldehyde-3-phosphate dehydrogenase [Planctomycetota bacterium]|nr:NADP-dependent glyceraldehyde-3-phosphate dehydrogenase [Planctomycetota bacterium]
MDAKLQERIAAVFPRPADVPEAFRLPKPVEQREYLLGGEIRSWPGELREVRSAVCLRGGPGGGPEPARLGAFPLLTEKEAAEALAAARRAYDSGRGQWPTMPVAERIRHVEAFAFRMKEKRDEVVRLLMWEIGKTLKDSQKEFDRTVEYIAGTIDALKELDRVSSRFSIVEGIIAQIRRAPLGVVLCMGPYNYPLNETFTTLIPALIMGNCAVFKPPRMGVLLFRPLLEAFRDSFPPGVVNTVYGEGRKVAGPMMAGGDVECLAFIGSSKAADVLKHQHPKPHRLRCVLGLDAKNAAIVMADADLDLAVAECVLGALSFNGQRCTAIKIIFVDRKVAKEFTQRLAAAVDKLAFGMPWTDGVSITPLPEPGKPGYLAELIAEAKAGGAEVLNAGGGAANATYFHPAVVYPVKPGMRLWTEAQFGPVVPVAPFDDVEEPVRYVVDSNYGQQVAVFGNDPKQLARLIDPLVNQVCRVNLNSQCQRGPDAFPFAGRKDSAEGTLSLSDALRVFSIRTLVAAKGTPANKEILSRIVREGESSFLSTDFIF